MHVGLEKIIPQIKISINNCKLFCFLYLYLTLSVVIVAKTFVWFMLQIHRSCNKLESEFGSEVSVEPGGSQSLVKEHHAARQAVHELLKFARSEADAIMAKLRQQVKYMCIFTATRCK